MNDTEVINKIKKDLRHITKVSFWLGLIFGFCAGTLFTLLMYLMFN